MNNQSSENLLEELNTLKVELAETQALLQGIQNASTNALLVVDKQLEIRLVNAAAEALFAYPKEELIGKSLSLILTQRFHAKDEEGFQRFLSAQHIDSPRFEHIQVACYPHNGEMSYGEASLSQSKVGEDTFLCISIDTAHLGEDKLHENHEQQRLLKLYNDLSTDYVFSVAVIEGVKPYYTWISNDAFKRVTGYSIDELGDGNDVYHPDDKARADADRDLTTIHGIPSYGEYRIVTKSGEIRWLAIKRFAEKHPETGRIVYIHGVANDITERKWAEEQRLRLLSEQARVKSMTDFVTSTSHDLMTSISIIKTSAYVLSKTDDEARRAAKLENIDKQSNRLQSIIEDMLQLVRLDSQDKQSIQKDKVQLDEFLKEAMASFQRRLIAGDHKLSLYLKEDNIEFSANTNYLHLALIKLLENAVHYTPKAGQITIHAERVENYLQIGIKDTGIGIRADAIPHIFERFYRAEEARSSEQGTGLGLSIVKAIMDLHEGEVLVKSELGKGSDFTLCFPLE